MAGRTIEVMGRSFTVTENGDGYYVGAEEVQGVNYHGSPTVIVFDQPVGPVSRVDLGEVYQAIKAKLPPEPLLLP